MGTPTLSCRIPLPELICAADGEFLIKTRNGSPAGFLTLAITEALALQDEVAKATTAAGAISGADLPAPGKDLKDLGTSFGDLIAGIDAVKKLGDELAEVGSRGDPLPPQLIVRVILDSWSCQSDLDDRISGLQRT